MNIQTKVLPPKDSSSKLIRARVEDDPFTILTMPWDHRAEDPERLVAHRLALALGHPSDHMTEGPQRRGYRTWHL